MYLLVEIGHLEAVGGLHDPRGIFCVLPYCEREQLPSRRGGNRRGGID